MDFEARSRFRLNELGFREHEPLRVVQKAMFGGRVVVHNGDRIALDGATARHIFVTPRPQLYSGDSFIPKSGGQSYAQENHGRITRRNP
ncbi:FeoA family protein [Bifidobacterium bohemicum DSM 22767]|uniref:FeoA family protein n=2 Tax=Bifidobacterium bohemicum TaxID=638617 RepID=A0A086ZE07_9BIFI|nr:FeoA family protein [Bifidobacterium bohemicum DSM 22767]